MTTLDTIIISFGAVVCRLKYHHRWHPTCCGEYAHTVRNCHHRSMHACSISCNLFESPMQTVTELRPHHPSPAPCAGWLLLPPTHSDRSLFSSVLLPSPPVPDPPFKFRPERVDKLRKAAKDKERLRKGSHCQGSIASLIKLEKKTIAADVSEQPERSAVNETFSTSPWRSSRSLDDGWWKKNQRLSMPRRASNTGPSVKSRRVLVGC